jgi:hypothetical protein
MKPQSVFVDVDRMVGKDFEAGARQHENGRGTLELTGA